MKMAKNLIFCEVLLTQNPVNILSRSATEKLGAVSQPPIRLLSIRIEKLNLFLKRDQELENLRYESLIILLIPNFKKNQVLLY